MKNVFLLAEDALNWLKVAVNTFTVLQRISIKNKIMFLLNILFIK